LLILGAAIKLSFFSLVIVKSVPLTHRFFGQLLVLIMNISFDFLNISLGILFSLLLELFKRGFILKLLLLLHPGEFDLDEVLLFLECLLKTCTVLLPSHQLKLVFQLLFADVLHFLKVFIQLINFHVRFLDLIFCNIVNLFYFFFVLVNSVVRCFFIFLLQGLDLIFELN
jgi:hypothetical protein